MRKITWIKLAKPLWMLVMLLVVLEVSASRVNADPSFEVPVLDPSQTDPIFKTLAGVFAFRPAEPAADLGRVWGVSTGLGLIGVDATEVNTVFQGSQIPIVPFADLQFALGVSNGVVVQFSYFPPLSFNSVNFRKSGAGLKWTLTRNIIHNLPFDLAAQFGYSGATLGMSQTITQGTPPQSARVDLTYSTTILSANAIISKRLLYFFEPFIGLGLTNHASTLASSGSASIFGNAFPIGTQDYSSAKLSAWYQAGILIHLFLVGISAQYDNMFGLTSYSGKVSIRF